MGPASHNQWISFSYHWIILKKITLVPVYGFIVNAKTKKIAFFPLGIDVERTPKTVFRCALSIEVSVRIPACRMEPRRALNGLKVPWALNAYSKCSCCFYHASRFKSLHTLSAPLGWCCKTDNRKNKRGKSSGWFNDDLMPIEDSDWKAGKKSQTMPRSGNRTQSYRG